jgi:mRNA interferase MazF
LKRGEIWTVAGGPEYAGKPRPALILQDNLFGGTASVTLIPFTTRPIDAPILRLAIEPSLENGLRQSSDLMIDKVSTVSRTKCRTRLGLLSEPDMLRVNRSVLVFLGLAGRG